MGVQISLQDPAFSSFGYRPCCTIIFFIFFSFFFFFFETSIIAILWEDPRLLCNMFSKLHHKPQLQELRSYLLDGTMSQEGRSTTWGHTGGAPALTLGRAGKFPGERKGEEMKMLDATLPTVWNAVWSLFFCLAPSPGTPDSVGHLPDHPWKIAFPGAVCPLTSFVLRTFITSWHAGVFFCLFPLSWTSALPGQRLYLFC